MNIEFKQLCFEYRSLIAEPRAVLNDISFSMGAGELVAVVGASGSGKTTLIQHINGLLRPSSGHLWIGDADLADPSTELQWIRNHVGLVFQFPEIQLFEETVQEDVAFGPKNLNWPKSKIDQQVSIALDLVGLDRTHFGPLHPFELSGGEKRRVAIAGVLAMDPRILILDEPTAGLDWTGVQKIESIIQNYHENGRTVIFVSHDMDLVARLAERILVLNNGQLIFDGSRFALFQQESLLKKAGLELPYIVRAINTLKKKGIEIRSDVFSFAEARVEIERYYQDNQ